MIVSAIPVSASSVSSSGVMDDLKKDSTFDITKYPVMTYEHFSSLNSDGNEKNDVKSISIIQIAESEEQNLYIYTYEPLAYVWDTTASIIRLATGKNSESYDEYKLSCISSDGAFKKYLVEDFKITSEFYRYYKITEIERPFNSDYDTKISDETITNSKAEAVGQTWCAYYKDNSLVYEMTTLEVVIIKPTLTDFVYYSDGFRLGSLVGLKTECRSHYIAFNVENYKVDKIIDADIEFKTRKYQETSIDYLIGNDVTTTIYPEGEQYKPNKKYLSNEKPIIYDAKGLTLRKYTWDRIMTAGAFVTNIEEQDGVLEANIKETLLKSQFVFAFAETECSKLVQSQFNDATGMLISTTTSISATEVLEVDIVRIKFEVDGKTYNLGVVSDKTTEDDIAGGGVGNAGLGIDIESIEDMLSELKESFTKIVAIILFAVLFFILYPFIKRFLKFLFKGFRHILEAVFTIITYPIQALFKRRRK